MKITFTDAAIDKITSSSGQHALLRLVYDTEGCGCAVNGVPALWLVSEPQERDVKADAKPFELVYSPKHEIFFEDELKIDFHRGTNSYILKSNNQIYSSGMSLVDKR